jgi:phosphoribosylanthranilate isomerase
MASRVMSQFKVQQSYEGHYDMCSLRFTSMRTLCFQIHSHEPSKMCAAIDEIKSRMILCFSVVNQKKQTRAAQHEKTSKQRDCQNKSRFLMKGNLS